jgi:hypothetical protein
MGKNNKSLSPCPFKKTENWTIHEDILSLRIRCMKFLFPKLFITMICPG